MTKISSLSSLTGAGVDQANDLLTIVDMSETGAARNKKITVGESRIGLGLGTADSPQFTAINLGHASDTTLTRVSAGVAAIEGVNIVTTAGGVTFAADVSVPDEAYDATAWNGSLEVPTKNAVRDKIETLAAGSGITVEDEGVSEGTGITTLNFTGAGVSVTVAGSEAEVIIAGGGGGVDIEDEGAAESSGATTLNFTGKGVTASDAGGGQTDINIPSRWEHIESLAPSGVASIDSDNWAGGNYKALRFTYRLTVSTDASTLSVRFNHNGGYKTTNYRSTSTSYSSSGSNNQATLSTGILLGNSGATWGIGNDTLEHIAGSFIVYDPFDTAKPKTLIGNSEHGAPSGAYVLSTQGGAYDSTDYNTALAGIQFFMSAGNMTGWIEVEGMVP